MGYAEATGNHYVEPNDSRFIAVLYSNKVSKS
ncbi:MAG: hypothetical protein CM1200mP9_01960 [Gammaproteobacteria bacterium]|nr:MAG: hypothetical protein CM1200mP9_01960 [Gammaproteobacteria bacterium]